MSASGSRRASQRLAASTAGAVLRLKSLAPGDKIADKLQQVPGVGPAVHRSPMHVFGHPPCSVDGIHRSISHGEECFLLFGAQLRRPYRFRKIHLCPGGRLAGGAKGRGGSQTPRGRSQSQRSNWPGHVQPGTGVCNLHHLDLEVGRTALQMAMDVRAIRKAKPLTNYVAAEREEDVVERAMKMAEAAFPGSTRIDYVDDAWRQWVAGRITVIVDNGHGPDLKAIWPGDVATLASKEPITVEQGETIERAIAYVEKTHSLPFPGFKPGTEPAPKPAATKRTMADEGDTVDDDAIAAVNTRAKALTVDGRQWANAVITEATKVNRPFRLSGRGGKPTQRRHAISLAVIAVADFTDDDLARALIALATGEQLTADHPLGDAFGTLTVDEANRLTQLAQAVTDRTLIATWHEHGVSIAGDINAATAA